MPSSLQYPLDRQRDVQRRWQRRLNCTDLNLVGSALPPRDRDDDDDEAEDEDKREEDREPATIREPDKDE